MCHVITAECRVRRIHLLQIDTIIHLAHAVNLILPAESDDTVAQNALYSVCNGALRAAFLCVFGIGMVNTL